jgi:DNA-binding NarL/FixJ family response regulator
VTPPPTVVLADDHIPTRAGVKASLQEGGFTVVADVGTGARAVEAALEHRPDVCVLDVHMPGGGGIHAAETISVALPGVAIVMLTVSEQDDDLLQSLRAGAIGYLLKHTNPDRLPDALRGVLTGEAAIPRVLVPTLVRAYRSAARDRDAVAGAPRPFELSEREWEVLGGLRAGKTTKQIALELKLSAITVRRHVSAVVAKVGAKNRDEALVIVGQHERARAS